MLNAFINPLLATPTKKLAALAADKSFTAKHIHLAALGIAVLAAFAAGMQAGFLGLILIILTLLARETALAMDSDKPKAQSNYLNELLGVIIFGLIVFLMGAGVGQNIGAAFVLFSFMVLSASDFVAELKGQDFSIEDRGQGFQFNPAQFVESAETKIYLLLIFIFPAGFAAISTVYGLMCWVTSLSRIFANVRDEESAPVQSKKPAPDIQTLEE